MLGAIVMGRKGSGWRYLFGGTCEEGWRAATGGVSRQRRDGWEGERAATPLPAAGCRHHYRLCVTVSGCARRHRHHLPVASGPRACVVRKRRHGAQRAAANTTPCSRLSDRRVKSTRRRRHTASFFVVPARPSAVPSPTGAPAAHCAPAPSRPPMSPSFAAAAAHYRSYGGCCRCRRPHQFRVAAARRRAAATPPHATDQDDSGGGWGMRNECASAVVDRDRAGRQAKKKKRKTGRHTRGRPCAVGGRVRGEYLFLGRDCGSLGRLLTVKSSSFLL